MTFAGLTLSQMLTLFGALGGAMVVLYILKLRRRRVEVPFAPLWMRVALERQSNSLFKALKRLFSLLLQLALLALVVAALGDPELGAASGCNYERPPPPPERHTVLVLDASASMSAIERGETRVERAREQAHQLIDALGDNPAHRVMVVQVDAEVRPLSLWTADREALHAAVDAYAPTGAVDTPTHVEDALELARTAIRGRAASEVVLLTDRAFDPLPPEEVAALGLKVVPIGEAGVNVGLQAFNVRPYLDDSLSYAIFYAIRNDSDRPLRATLYLYANEDGRSVSDFLDRGSVVGSYALDLPPGGVLEDVVDDVSFAGSRLAARVEIAADEPVRDLFGRDDVAFAVVPERKRLKVQLVTEGNLFLHASLFVRENVDFQVVAPGAYAGPQGFDVTVVDGVAVDMSKPGAYFVLDPQPGGPFEVTGELEEPEVKRLDKKHPIARHLKLVDLNIAAATVVTKERGDQVVAAAQDGVPLVMTRVDVEGRRLFAMVAFDLRKSLLPLNYAFPLLVVNVLNWFYQEDDALLRPNRAGAEVSVAFPLAGSDITVLGPPDADTVPARRVDDRVHFATDRIGIYEFSTPESEAPLAVAINLMSEAESRLNPRGEYPAWQAPPPWQRQDDPWLENLWRVLLLAMLGLLVLEWITWNRRVTV